LQIKTVELNQIHPIESGLHIFDEENFRSENQSPPNIFTAPVFLQAKSDGYKILYGFGAIQSLRKSAAETVQAYIIPPGQALVTTLKMIADFILRTRNLWPVEIARCLLECEKQKTASVEKSNLFRKLTGTDLTAALEERYLALNRLDSHLIRFLIEKKAPLKTWLLATELPGELEPLLQLIVTDGRPTLSVFEEIGRNLLEIIHREAIEPQRLVNEFKIIFEAEDVSASEKLARLRAQIQERRFPHLMKHRQDILHLLEKIKLPPSVRLDYDKNFEDLSVGIYARIGTTGDLAELCQFLNGPARQQLQQLLKTL
jgi:hypothetical protein